MTEPFVSNSYHKIIFKRLNTHTVLFPLYLKQITKLHTVAYTVRKIMRARAVLYVKININNEHNDFSSNIISRRSWFTFVHSRATAALYRSALLGLFILAVKRYGHIGDFTAKTTQYTLLYWFTETRELILYALCAFVARLTFLLRRTDFHVLRIKCCVYRH